MMISMAVGAEDFQIALIIIAMISVLVVLVAITLPTTSVTLEGHPCFLPICHAFTRLADCPSGYIGYTILYIVLYLCRSTTYVAYPAILLMSPHNPQSVERFRARPKPLL